MTADTAEDNKDRYGRPGDLPPQTMVEIAYESIVAGIMSQRYRGGDIVQEAKIAQSLGLSRTPVREALGRLEGEGLLVRFGRATAIKSISVQEYLEALHIRRLVEDEAINLACGSMPIAALQALRARVEALHDRSQITPDAHWAIDDDLHQGIAKASGNRTLAQLIMDLRLKTRLFNLDKLPDRFLPGRSEHLAILDALISQDVEAARMAMRLHLENVKASIFAALVR